MRSIRADSTEWLTVTLTADHDITGDDVEMSLDGGATWHTAEHVTGGVRLLVGPGAALPLTTGVRTVYVRIHDMPEIPVLSAGALTVVA